jgi:hypothetical protein
VPESSDDPGPRFEIHHVDDLDWHEVKAQQHGDRRASVWEKFLEMTPGLTVIYAKYDPGVVVERHGHRSDHLIFVLDGEITVGDHECGIGTHILLEQGAAFGPIIAGPKGAFLYEVMMGDPRAVPADKAELASLLAARGIEELPNPPLELPDWLGPRVD